MPRRQVTGRHPDDKDPSPGMLPNWNLSHSLPDAAGLGGLTLSPENITFTFRRMRGAQDTLNWMRFLERFSNSRAPASQVKGGFYFHPGDEGLSPGTPERKKPLSVVLPEYSYWRTALGD